MRKVGRFSAIAVSATLIGSGVAVVTTVAATPAALAVGCTGVSCDNKGPSANGCFAVDEVLASGSFYGLQLRYSPACHAFWAYGGDAPAEWNVTLELDWQKKNAAGDWVTQRTLEENFAAQGPADWTNMLGARTKDSRFRALVAEPNSTTIDTATTWVVGGDH